VAGACCLLLAVTAWPGVGPQAGAAEASKAEIIIVVGPCQHPPGTHEAAAGARLLEYCVEHAGNVEKVPAEVYYAWPEEESGLEHARTVVFIGDRFPPERMDEPEKIKVELGAMMDRGCGIVCVHYATGLRAQHVAEDGDHPLLRWMGGYFATGCRHHRSVARVLTATIVPEKGDHPVLRGWEEFTFDDEPYWNNYFGKDGPAENVTPLAFSMLPPDEPNKEIVAWAVARPDGGRGVGVVLPHYFRNWGVDALRTLVLNAIFWTAKLDVPGEGVKASLPELSIFQPESVDPRPRVKKRPTAAP
jgi:type 1 glutamine amidotransferase